MHIIRLNALRRAPDARRRPASSLEREVITAVVALYLVLSGAMLVVHFALGGEGSDSPTATSSTSPTHAAAAAGAVAKEGAAR